MITLLTPFLLLLTAALCSAQGKPATCPSIPDKPILSKLTDPFTFFGGGQVRTKADWDCRREEIKQLLQRYELGTLPPPPDKTVGALRVNEEGSTFIDVTVTHEEKTIMFSVPVKYPTNSDTTDSFPALIGVGYSGSIPAPPDAAVLIFPNDAIAAQTGVSSRGRGLFFELYGGGHSAGSMIAWAWGMGRLIDALESLPEAKINTKRLAVTGCSRNGKGALVIGAFEPRIAVTIPQESGTGGSGCWRIADHLLFEEAENVQTGQQIVLENTWLSPVFNNYSNKTGILPFDHHLLISLVAPRGLLIIEHSNIDWLGPKSVYGCTLAARKVYEALGRKDNFGYTATGDHPHCLLPESQNPRVEAYYDKFIRGKEAKTGFFESDIDFKFVESDWIDWKTPKL